MLKQWGCTQCGAYHKRGIIASVYGEPDECGVRGNMEFDPSILVGRVHETVDRFVF
jgi:hypothetical protein